MATISCDPQDLITASAPYQRISGQNLQNEVIIYLLNQILDTGLTPQQLIDAVQAGCYECIPVGMRQEVITYLLCQIVNK